MFTAAVPLSLMASILGSKTMVRTIANGATSDTQLPVKRLNAGQSILHQGVRYRVLAKHTISGKALVEPLNNQEEEQ